jgi:mevalonate kinase
MKASAPGKIFLFGEHAVVYGKKALVTAIDLRCFADVKKRDDFRISSPIGITGLDFEKHPYISYAIKRFMEIKEIKGADIEIKSQIPVASGLGSSSAVTVSVLKALDAEFEASLTNEEIYEIARKVELDVQGIGSGTDPFISTYGGCWLIPDRKPVNIGKVYFLVINTEEKSITGDMVKKVASLRKEFPDVVDSIMSAIGGITSVAIPHLENLNNDKISKLIRMNQCLLKSIGVSSEKIDEIVMKLNSLGIPSKLTGAGGGGCVIAIGDLEKLTEVTKVFPNAFFVKPEKEGAKVE